MMEWKIVTLSDLGEIVGGATPATSREDYYNGDIPWLTPKDLAVYSGHYIHRGERNITRAGLESCSTRLLPKNTVLFSSRARLAIQQLQKMIFAQIRVLRVLCRIPMCHTSFCIIC